MQANVDRVQALPFASVAQQERAAAFTGAIVAMPSNIVRLVSPFPCGHLRLL
jgi:hypothetical protein